MTEINRYSHTKIYKLIDKVNQHFYIGSTTSKYLAKRKADHKADSLRHPERPVYKYFNSVGWSNVTIVLIEELNLQSKEQQMQAEDRYIQQYIDDERCLNAVRAVGMNRKEYYQLHKNKRLEIAKIWRKNNPEQTKLIMNKCYTKNREKYLEQKRQIYICECGVSLTKGTKKKIHKESEHHQKWMQSNQNDINIQIMNQKKRTIVKKHQNHV